MERVIPTFYAEYGRYISRFRMIPLNIDCLLPVERRVLIIMNKFGTGKSIKSARIDGDVTGSLHPHGSCYGTIVQLVRNGFASDVDSSWGGNSGLKPSPPPASRYTETRILPWVANFAFEYVKDVPWETLELESEPLYLPCVLPLGLIGSGIINGLSFHKTVIPKYKKEDLARRLIWLLENRDNLPKIPKSWNKKMDESLYGPCIKPNKPDCNLIENENDFYKLLMLGEGKINYQPKINICEIEATRNKKKQKIKVIEIIGKAPNATFEPLLKDYDSGKLPLVNLPTDQSKKQDTCIYLEPKRGTNLEEFKDTISSKYLNKTLHFKCYTCNLEGVVNQTSIDELLLNCIDYWKQAYLEHICNEVTQLSQKVVENYICEFLHQCVLNQVKDLKDILEKWKKVKHDIKIYFVHKETRKIKDETYTITDDKISEIYTKTPIKKLVEFKQNQTLIQTKIQEKQKELDNIDQKPLERLREII